jgi:hypothetical protein
MAGERQRPAPPSSARTPERARARRRQAPAANRAAALAAVLERALEAAGGRPAKALPRLATAFAAEQVAAAVSAAGAAAAGAGEGGDPGAGHAGYDAKCSRHSRSSRRAHTIVTKKRSKGYGERSDCAGGAARALLSSWRRAQGGCIRGAPCARLVAAVAGGKPGCEQVGLVCLRCAAL